MTYFNGMLYHFKRNALVEGSTHFKEMHHSFSRESFKVFEHVLPQGFEATMSISKSVLHIHWLPMFLHLFNTVFEKLHKLTKLPNLCPKPPKLSPVIPAFCHVSLAWFSNGTTGQSNQLNQPKTSLQPLKWENWQRVRSRSVTFVLSCQPFEKPTTNQKTRNQETKKPRNQKNKKQKNENRQDCTPQGGE